jgi:hypothetical protein
MIGERRKLLLVEATPRKLRIEINMSPEEFFAEYPSKQEQLVKLVAAVGLSDAVKEWVEKSRRGRAADRAQRLGLEVLHLRQGRPYARE